jgi:putative hemolysin
MNKNRGLTPLAVVLMLSGSLALTGCDDKPAQQGAQHMPEVGIVTLKSDLCNHHGATRPHASASGAKFVLRSAALF